MEPSEPPHRRPAVTLDLWLTLVAELDRTSWSKRRSELRVDNTIEVIRSHGLLVDEEALRKAYASISDMVSSDHDLGLDLQFSDRVVQVLSMVDEKLPAQLGPEGLAEVGSAVDRAFTDTPPSFLPGSKEALERLRGMDVTIGLISNVGMTSADAYREWFSREGVLQFFDHLTFSNDVACAKPSPHIYTPTLEHLNAEAKGAIHIGDNLLADVSGAAGVGMRTGWISGFDAREPIVEPDYTLDGISDVVSVVERWLEGRQLVAG